MAHLPINESQHSHAAALLASSHFAGPEVCSEHIDMELIVLVQAGEQVYSVPVENLMFPTLTLGVIPFRFSPDHACYAAGQAEILPFHRASYIQLYYTDNDRLY